MADVGERRVAEIFHRIEMPIDHPDMGQVVPEFGQTFLRELIQPPFRIVYRRNGSLFGCSGSGTVDACWGFSPDAND